jgi:hypothetical protein
MKHLRFSLGTFAVLALTAGCGGSSTAPKGTPGPSDASVAGDSGAVAEGGTGLIMATCGALSQFGGGGGDGGTCPTGDVCCTTLSLPPSASCVPEGQCTGISTACSSATDCSGGQVCCVGSADGGAGISADAAAGGGFGGFGGFDPSQFSSACQSSCTGSQTQYCTVDADCPPGMGLICQGGGSQFGFSLPSVCAPPLPDAGIRRDAGEGDLDSGTPDAGSVDAGAEQ